MGYRNLFSNNVLAIPIKPGVSIKNKHFQLHVP